MYGTRRAALALILAACLLSLICAAASPASPISTKKARLKAVQTKLDSVYAQVETAVEKYNQATSQLDTVERKIEENQRLLDTAARNLQLANKQLKVRAANIYKSRDVGIVDVLFQADSFDELITQLDMMNRIGNSDVDTVKAIAAYRRDIKDRRLELEVDKEAAAKLVADRAAQKSQIIGLESRLEKMTHGLKAEIKRLREKAALAAKLAAQASWGGIAPPPVDPNSPGHPEIVTIAQRYFGVPYVWGGASPSGFDCSGLTHVLLRADRHPDVARGHGPAAPEHTGRAQRPASRRPRVLRQRQLQPPRRHLRRRRQRDRGAAHRRRRALRFAGRARRLDRRPVLGPDERAEVSFWHHLPK